MLPTLSGRNAVVWALLVASSLPIDRRGHHTGDHERGQLCDHRPGCPRVGGAVLRERARRLHRRGQTAAAARRLLLGRPSRPGTRAEEQGGRHLRRPLDPERARLPLRRAVHPERRADHPSLPGGRAGTVPSAHRGEVVGGRDACRATHCPERSRPPPQSPRPQGRGNWHRRAEESRRDLRVQ
jgi:hypothetical protein